MSTTSPSNSDQANFGQTAVCGRRVVESDARMLTWHTEYHPVEGSGVVTIAALSKRVVFGRCRGVWQNCPLPFSRADASP